MQRPESSRLQDPLDLLRRFIPTPLKAVYRIGEIRVVVETNDFSLLPTLPLDADLDEPQRLRLEWKLVRDADSQAPLDAPVFLTSGALTVVGMGGACLLGVDHERRELFGFIGAGVDGSTYQEFLVPYLSTITNEVVYGGRDECASGSYKESADG